MMIIPIIIIAILPLVLGLIWWNDKLYSEIESINIKLQNIRKELDANSHLIRQNTSTLNDMNLNVFQTMNAQHYASQELDDFEKSTKEEIENIKKQITEPYKII